MSVSLGWSQVIETKSQVMRLTCVRCCRDTEEKMSVKTGEQRRSYDRWYLSWVLEDSLEQSGSEGWHVARKDSECTAWHCLKELWLILYDSHFYNSRNTLLLQQPCEAGSIIIPILQMKDLRRKEIKWSAYGFSELLSSEKLSFQSRRRGWIFTLKPNALSRKDRSLDT